MPTQVARAALAERAMPAARGVWQPDSEEPMVDPVAVDPGLLLSCRASRMPT